MTFFTGGENLDTDTTLFREAGRSNTFFVRIVRLYYAISMDGPHPSSHLCNTSFKSFTPAMLVNGGWFSVPKYETQSATMHRAMAWLKATGQLCICVAQVS